MSEPSRTSEGQGQGSPGPSQGRGGVLLAVAILLASANLRPAVASIGPVLDDIRADLGLSAAAASVLTTLPVLCFGAGALVAPRLARRFGTEATLTGVVGLTGVGLLLRTGPDAFTLFGGTFLAGAGIAVGNVLLPALVKREFAHRAGLLMGLYISVVVVMASVAAGATVPITEGFGGRWRAGLGAWAVPAVLAFCLWLAVTAARRRRSLPDDRTSQAPSSLLGDRIAWKVTAFIGIQALGFYALLSWLPSMYRSYGMTPEVAGHLLSLLLILGVPTALVTPSLLTRLQQQSGVAVGTVVLTAMGMLGLLLAPTSYPYLWVTLMGVGLGVGFPLGLTLVVLRSRDAQDAAQLSGMSQSVGYTLAAAGPFIFGLLHDLSGGWMVPVAFLLALMVPQALAARGAGRPVYVGQAQPDHASRDGGTT